MTQTVDEFDVLALHTFQITHAMINMLISANKRTIVAKIELYTETHQDKVPVCGVYPHTKIKWIGQNPCVMIVY